ncbi:hypothetical protein [Acinetobacter seifertii]|uniref:hypothetical protein n=1 Tax=Acinetobacter seifertii TaxID=1530123 RepID=UPI00083AA8E8|nr:hypothetical protein [Acinetobacter seifertii]OCZ53655.1 hypothetical protein A7P21_14045 [Acinetobacter seifertii]
MKFFRSYKNIILLIFIAMIIVNTLIVLIPKIKGDTKNENDERMKICGGGINKKTESQIWGKIAKFLNIETSTSVIDINNTEIIKNIRSNEYGAKMYQAYVDCVIPPHPPFPPDINRSYIEIATKLNEINSNSPKEKIVEVMGQPFSEEPLSDENIDPPITISRYQYNDAYFVADYHEGTKRLGLVIGYLTPSKYTQADVNIKNLQKTQLGTIITYCMSEPEISSHFGISTGICGGSHADNYEYQVYFFSMVDRKNVDPILDKNCNPLESKKFSETLRNCDKLDNTKPYAIALSKNEQDLNLVKNLFTDETDVGNNFNFHPVETP